MINKFQKFISFLDIEDLRFIYIIAKKNIKHLLSLSVILGLLVYFVSLNLEKKYLSTATLVIAPDENNLVNIEEVYSIESLQNRVNNQIAILKSEEVIDYIVEDKKNELEFKNLYASSEKNFLTRIFTKKK